MHKHWTEQVWELKEGYEAHLERLKQEKAIKLKDLIQTVELIISEDSSITKYLSQKVQEIDRVQRDINSLKAQIETIDRIMTTRKWYNQNTLDNPIYKTKDI